MPITEVMNHKKYLVIALLAGFGLASAAGDRLIEPIQPVRSESRTSSNDLYVQYVGSGKLRFLQVNLPTYAVLGAEGMLVRIEYLSPNGPAKGLRMTPVSGGSSVLIDLSKLNSNIGQQFPAATPSYSSNFFLNAADFGPNPNENVAYRTVLVGQDGQDGEPIVVALNFRSVNDFREDPRLKLARDQAAEPLEDVLAIGFYQAFGDSSLSVYSIESYRTYSRVRVALRLPQNYDLGGNAQTIRQALEEGKVTGRDDTGQHYKVALGNDLRPSIGANALEFSLIMTPRLSSDATRGVVEVAPFPDRVINGVTYKFDEPFRSGFSLPLVPKR
jgi:hypothetical protein